VVERLVDAPRFLVFLDLRAVASRVIEFIFGAILYVIPGSEAFAENDVFFASYDLIAMLGNQLATVSIYALFLLAVCLIDFYRKEFNL
jgi:hypothetical protein